MNKATSSYKFILSILIIAVAVFYACNTDSEEAQDKQVLEQKFTKDINFDDIPLKNISDYGLFLGNPADLKPNEGVLLYEPSATLFTDYAHKSRYIWMPNGASGKILDNDWQQIEFPDKTIIVKNFYYPEDFSKPEENINVLETRLLVKRDGEWDAFPYVWNEDKSDAIYKVIGAKIPVSFTRENGETHTIDYLVPNKHQCKSCHNQDDKFLPIGPKARNMNHAIEYPDGVEMNQLEKWASMGYLSNFSSSKNYQTVPNYYHTELDLNDRARSYLEGNCAHCHNPKGPASTSGLFLTYEQQDSAKLGYYKTPVAAGIGAGPHTFDIYPGKADSSIITYRMNSTQPGVMMAEIGRAMIHEEGVELISEWINSLQ